MLLKVLTLLHLICRYVNASQCAGDVHLSSGHTDSCSEPDLWEVNAYSEASHTAVPDAIIGGTAAQRQPV